MSWKDLARNRPRYGPTIAVVALALVALLGAVQQRVGRFGMLALFGAVLLGCVGLAATLWSRLDRDRTRPDVRDVTGVRVVLPAAALAVLRDVLRAVATEPEALSRTCSLLLAERGRWCLAGVDGTPPLPPDRAARLFDGWCADARSRFSHRAARGAQAPAPADAVLVVCLHVEATREIPDPSPNDPSAAEQTLTALRGLPADAITRLDVWPSEHPMCVSAIRDADRTLLPIS